VQLTPALIVLLSTCASEEEEALAAGGSSSQGSLRQPRRKPDVSWQPVMLWAVGDGPPRLDGIFTGGFNFNA
jgi:hypothetical protein